MPEREVAVCSADEGQQARNSCPELRIFFLLASHGLIPSCTNLVAVVDAEGCFEAKRSENPQPGPANAEPQTPPPAAGTHSIIVPNTPKSAIKVLRVNYYVVFALQVGGPVRASLILSPTIL